MSDLDVTKAIQPKSDQLNSDSLITGPMTIKIRDVKVNSTAEQPVWIYFEGDDNKPWKPCKTAMRCMATIWGANAAQWVGMSLTIYNDPTVTWAGVAVGGIRVSHMEGIDKPRQLQLTKTRGKKGAVTIQPLIIKDEPKADIEPMLKAARAAAKGGTDSFRKWWTETPEGHQAAKTIMDELKKTAAENDTPDDEMPL